MIGDSALYSSIGPGIDIENERLSDHLQLVFNREQAVFNFCYNYFRPGASYVDIFSPNSVTRGLPDGVGGSTDLVHPSQEYSRAIFTYVARSIGGT